MTMVENLVWLNNTSNRIKGTIFWINGSDRDMISAENEHKRFDKYIYSHYPIILN